MDSYDEHSAWRFQYQPPVKVAAKLKKASLLSRLANFIFLSGTLLFVCQIYDWLGKDEWTRYPSIVLVKYLPAGYLSALHEAGFVKGLLLWVLESADLSVMLILMGFLIAKVFADAE